MFNSAAVLNDSEVRTLPPIVAGGLHAPAGNSPVARYVTGLPQEPYVGNTGMFKLAPDLMRGSTLREADKSSATMHLSRKQPASRGVAPVAPSRNVPLNASTAAAIIFNDTSVSALLNQKLVASNVDLGPALQASPAVLVRHADPNAAARVAMLARSRQLQHEDSSGMKRASAMARARQPQQPAMQTTTVNVAALRLDTKTPSTLPAAAASSQLHRFPYSPGPSQPVSGKSGVQVSVTPQLLNVNLAASMPATRLPLASGNQSDDASLSELTPRRAAARAGSSNDSRMMPSSASQTKSKLTQDSSTLQQQAGDSLEGDAKLLFALIREQDKAASAAGRGRPGSTYVAVPLKRRQPQSTASGKSTTSAEAKEGQLPNAAANDQAKNGMDPEMIALDGNIGMIRDYLALLNKFGPQSFLIYRGKTLRATPDFQLFAHDQARCWPEVTACLDRLEDVLSRHGVPLAVVAGSKLANLARTALGPSARRLPDLLDCLENLDQVAVQVQFPGSAPPRGDTARIVRRKAAVRVQTAMRGLAERRRFVARLAAERAARVIETCARGMLGRWRGRLLHHMRRASMARARVLLKNRLKNQWEASELVRDSAHQAPKGQALNAAAATNGVDPGAPALPSSLGCWPAGRVEVHVPSLSLSESLRLMASPFPHMQAHDGGVSRIARLRDPSLAHLVLVLPALVPDDVLDYWCGLVRLADGKERSGTESRPGGLRRSSSRNADPRARVTVVVPEMSAYFAPHTSLADALLLSPQALNRIRNLVDRHAGVSTSASPTSVHEEMEGLDSPEAIAEDELAASEEPPEGTSWLHGGADGARIAAEPFMRCRATSKRAAFLLPGVMDKATTTTTTAAAAGGKWRRSCTSEELLSVELGLPLVGGTSQGGDGKDGGAALMVKTRSGSKSVFVDAGCRVAIGAHAIKTQDDLVIALVKLIAANLDVEEWVLRCENDLPGGAALGVARFQAASLPEVHRLRQERAQLLKQPSHRNTSSAGGLTGGGGEGGLVSWGSAEMQLKVRARLLPDLRQYLPGQIQLARPDAFPRGWFDFLNFFLRHSGVVEAEPPSLCGRVSAHLFLAPHCAKELLKASSSSQIGAGQPNTTPQSNDHMSSQYSSGVAVESTQEVITTKHGLALAAAHPQRCISPQALERAARAVGCCLLSRGVIGHVSVSFAVFREAPRSGSSNSKSSSGSGNQKGTTASSSSSQGGQLRMWGESIEPWCTPAAQAHAACALLASSGPPSNNDMNEVALLHRDKNMNELPTPYSQTSPYPMHTPMYSPLANFDQSANQNTNAVPTSSSNFHHPFPSVRDVEGLGRGIGSTSTSGVGTPSGLAYVTTTGALLHPGLAHLGPGGFDSLLRLARLHHRVYDRTTGAGDAFWPCDALIGGAVGFASLAPRNNERAAAKAFHGLVKGFLAKQVGTRTHAVLASLGAEAAQEAVHGGDPDGYGSMVRMETVAKDTHARFEKRLQDQRAAKQKAIDDAKAAKEQEANLAAAAKRRAEKASMNEGRNTPKSRSGRRH